MFVDKLYMNPSYELQKMQLPMTKTPQNAMLTYFVPELQV